MKLSSRLQSRIAKRRNAISHFEQERMFGKLAVSMGRTLLSVGLIGEQELTNCRDNYRHTREVVTGMADDQQLDKSLLGLVYKLENVGYEGVMHVVDGSVVSIQRL